MALPSWTNRPHRRHTTLTRLSRSGHPLGCGAGTPPSALRPSVVLRLRPHSCAQSLANGHYEVTLNVSARKLYADENGAQKEAPMDELVDIGVYDAKGDALYLKKHRVKTGESTYTIDVAGKPVKAGIDPVVKLVDRRPDDNTVVVN